MNERPPAWADLLLRLMLSAADRECVSGDLLEQYRDDVVPRRGRESADVWYVRQVCSYVWRGTWPWVIVFAGGFVARVVCDWRVPTTDFATRSAVTTAVGVMTLVSVGFWTSWRSGAVLAGVIAAAVTSQLAAVFSVAGVTLTLAVWHDPGTMRAIAGSGGLAEAYTLPFLTIVPAIALGSIGGALGSLGRRLQ